MGVRFFSIVQDTEIYPALIIFPLFSLCSYCSFMSFADNASAVIDCSSSSLMGARELSLATVRIKWCGV